MTKRYLLAAAAHNLGRILRKLFGVGKPKRLQGESSFAVLAQFIVLRFLIAVRTILGWYHHQVLFRAQYIGKKTTAEKTHTSTDC